MNIVFVTPSLKTGGGNRVFFELANQLADTHNITILFPNNSHEINTFNINSHIELRSIGIQTKKKKGKLLNLLRCIRCLNKEYRNSIVIITDPIFSIFSFSLRSSSLYRFIQADDYRIYDDGMILGKGLVLKVYKQLCLYSYHFRIGYIFNSSFIYHQYRKDSKMKNIPFHLVHPALNHHIFNSLDHFPNTEKLTISLVARKHPLKGLINFIHVFHNLPLQIRNKIKNVILISHDDLSGFDTQGMEIIKPSCDYEIANVYKRSDIFISTSLWEGFGLPPLEAMACGCAVITSDSGGVDEYAIPEKNCLMYKPKDEIQLQEQLCRLIENKELRNRLAINGIQTASLFDWKKSAGQLLEIIKYNT